MEKKDYLVLVLLLVSIFGKTLGLRCFSCTTDGSKCSYTVGCHGECYKAIAKRTITNVNDKSGKLVVMTTVGCITNCLKEQKNKACYGDIGCNLTCCKTDYCNPLMPTDTGYSGQSYPTCHSCSSTKSYEDCQARSSLNTCAYTTGTSYCYKMDYKSSYGTKKHIYKKGCVRSYTGCDTLRTSYCSGGNSADCNLHCCSGNACNVGAGTVVSALAILSCAALAMLFNRNIL